MTKQLAGYGAITRRFDYDAYGIFIGLDIDDPNAGGDVCIVKLTELDAGLRAIEQNLLAWFADNKFDPRRMYAEGKCMRRSDIIGSAASPNNIIEMP